MHLESTLLILFGVAAAVAIISHRLRLPYTIALVLTGLVLGAIHVLQAPHLSKELLFLIVLPGLIFEAAYHMEFREFWAAKLSIFSLAVPGLLVAVGATGFMVWLGVNQLGFGSLTLMEAMVFGALIAATDPISVLAIFKTLGVDRKLYVLVEGESLFNDGTAVVVFTILLAMATGHETSLGGAVYEFVKVTGMAAAVGAVMGSLGSLVTRTLEEPVIEITLTALTAYGSFIIAEHFGYSGVIACVVAGMLTGNWGARIGMSATTRLAVESFWEYAAFVLNSLVFLLVGLEVKIGALVRHVVPILVAWVAVVVGRAAVVSLKQLIVGRLAPSARMPSAWAAALTWGGLRGGLSMVLALALPRTFVHRELILTLTFGVVLLSLLVQGLTMKPLLTRLGLAGRATDREAYERRLARLRAAGRAVEELEAMHRARTVPTAVFHDLHARYTERVKQLEAEITELHLERDDIRAEESLAVRRHLLAVEKESLRETYQYGLIAEPVLRGLTGELDQRLLELEIAASHPGDADDEANGESKETTS